MGFIPDKVIHLTEENDILETRHYADALFEIIENADESCTIGLFGPWGSGKSSIIETLYRKINAENVGKSVKDKKNKDNKSPKKGNESRLFKRNSGRRKRRSVFLFKFDAWKYAENDIDRVFISSLVNSIRETGLGKDSELDNIKSSLYTSKSATEISTEIGSKNVYKKLINIYFKLLLIALIPTIIIALANYTYDLYENDSLGNWLSGLLSVFLLKYIPEVYINIVIAGVIVTVLTGALINEIKVNTVTPPIFSIEQFEKTFTELIGILFKNNKIDKVVITIDNLDRCDTDIVLGILKNIKTFLELKDHPVIFIIPIDSDNLKNALSKRGYNPNDYLRKVFNFHIMLRKFYERDLINYARSLNKEYGLGISDGALQIIVEEFSDNPRRVIQLMNSVTIEFRIAERLEKEMCIPEGLITGYPLALAKMLIIREEFPSIYTDLIEKPYLFNDLEKLLEQKEESLKKDGRDILTERLRRFVKRTEYIKHPRPEILIFIKDIRHGIPPHLYDFIISGDWNGIKDEINKGERLLTPSEIVDFICDIINEQINKLGKYETIGYNLIRLIHSMVTDEEFGDSFIVLFSKKGRPRLDIINILLSERTYKMINNEDIPLLLDIAGRIYSLQYDTSLDIISSSFAKMEGSEGLSNELVIGILRSLLDFEPDLLSKIEIPDKMRNASINVLGNNNFLDRVLSELNGEIESKQVLFMYFMPEILERWMNFLPNIMTDNDRVYKFIMNFIKSYSKKERDLEPILKFEQKIRNLISTSIDDNRLARLLRFLCGLIEIINTDFSDEQINSFYANLWNILNFIWNESSRRFMNYYRYLGSYIKILIAYLKHGYNKNQLIIGVNWVNYYYNRIVTTNNLNLDDDAIEGLTQFSNFIIDVNISDNILNGLAATFYRFLDFYWDKLVKDNPDLLILLIDSLFKIFTKIGNYNNTSIDSNFTFILNRYTRYKDSNDRFIEKFGRLISRLIKRKHFRNIFINYINTRINSIKGDEIEKGILPLLKIVLDNTVLHENVPKILFSIIEKNPDKWKLIYSVVKKYTEEYPNIISQLNTWILMDSNLLKEIGLSFLELSFKHYIKHIGVEKVYESFRKDLFFLKTNCRGILNECNGFIEKYSEYLKDDDRTALDKL